MMSSFSRPWKLSTVAISSLFSEIADGAAAPCNDTIQTKRHEKKKLLELEIPKKLLEISRQEMILYVGLLAGEAIRKS